MAEAKPVASLSPTLLARKGGARPAPRAQVEAAGDTEEGARISSTVRSKNKSGGKVVALDTVRMIAPAAKAQAVRRQRERLAAELSGSAKPRKAPAPAPQPERARPAAFTLRLDADRHLKLRLASALANRSAQQIVTEALDSMFANLPDVAAMAARAGKRR